MDVSVGFGLKRFTCEIPPERVVEYWRGPESLNQARIPDLAREAISSPLQFPPLRSAIVPGDRVVLAVDVRVPALAAILEEVAATLQSSGVERESIHVVGVGPEPLGDLLPREIEASAHDPSDRNAMAYLASTADGRRVYLNRQLTDADVVIAIGRLTFDPAIGCAGPWSVIFPGSSDAETQTSGRARMGRSNGRAADEAVEVCWLLGSQFGVGVLPAADSTGVASIRAGLMPALRDEAERLLKESWVCRPPGQADLVVCGVGAGPPHATFDMLGAALEAATAAVRPRGAIVIMSDASGTIGRAWELVASESEREKNPSGARAARSEPDAFSASQLAAALARAKVYLLSNLDATAVEDLSIVPLDEPADAARLITAAKACTFVNRAELTSVRVAGDEAPKAKRTAAKSRGSKREDRA